MYESGSISSCSSMLAEFLPQTGRNAGIAVCSVSGLQLRSAERGFEIDWAKTRNRPAAASNRGVAAQNEGAFRGSATRGRSSRRGGVDAPGRSGARRGWVVSREPNGRRSGGAAAQGRGRLRLVDGWREVCEAEGGGGWRLRRVAVAHGRRRRRVAPRAA